MGRFRFNNTPPSSERGPRFLIVGRKRVSAYDLWQCPYSMGKKIRYKPPSYQLRDARPDSDLSVASEPQAGLVGRNTCDLRDL